MKFNSYVWQLYLRSSEGELAIDIYSNLLENISGGKFQLNLVGIPVEFTGREWEITHNFIEDYSKEKIVDISDAESFFNEIMDVSPVTDEEDEMAVDDGILLYYLSELSLGLYTCFPEFFFPYLFIGHFYLFQKICASFKIALPEIPKKRNLHKRLFYYFELCRTLYEFRRSYNLSPVELCAFLYSFAPNFVEMEIDDELPKPMRVWVVGAGIDNNGDSEFLDQIDETSVAQWQGNMDTKRGDIVLVYCLTPRSYIHSIWRAKTDGYIDPFFYYYSSIWLSNPIKITPVTFNELRRDPLLMMNGLIKRSMQGVNGMRFSCQEYEAILQLAQNKGQDISLLPKIEAVYEAGSKGELLRDERDVEVNLIEPLLEKLGYGKNDWTRQMRVRMGSGEKVYPDYAVFPTLVKGEEQAPMILEAKFRIRTNKELLAAYWQAKSYALRLQSKRFVLGALEGIWIFFWENNSFDSKKYIYQSWEEIYDPDVFSDVLNLIGPKIVKRNK